MAIEGQGRLFAVVGFLSSELRGATQHEGDPPTVPDGRGFLGGWCSLILGSSPDFTGSYSKTFLQ
jgi:hypothetical protein